MLCQRGKEKTQSYRFRFGGRTIHESSRSRSRTVAREAEERRRHQLEESWNQITRRTFGRQARCARFVFARILSRTCS
jgi:hypothetical protein